MKKAIKIFLFLILVIAVLVFRSVYASGYFKTIQNRFSGTTQRIEGVAGVEDITIDQSTGIAFLSSDDRWANRRNQTQKVKGAIYTLNLNDSMPKPLNKTIDFPDEDFHPHGISLFTTQEGKKLLFVINHREKEHVIEVFEYKNDSLIHQKSIKGSLLISPNDIVAVGENAFYFTNDHNEKHSLGRTIKDFLFIGTGSVCYFDGQKIEPTGIEGLKYANGINTRKDGKYLYVAETSGKCLNIYERNTQTGALTFAETLHCDTGVDNIELDTEGVLWVGCHPQMLQFLKHSKDEKAVSPSEIIKVTYVPQDVNRFKQETIYMNTGSEISASSVAAVYKNKMLIGPVFQRHIVLANMK
jgi:arylesterase / paraoxonase